MTRTQTLCNTKTSAAAYKRVVDNNIMKGTSLKGRVEGEMKNGRKKKKKIREGAHRKQK